MLHKTFSQVTNIFFSLMKIMLPIMVVLEILKYLGWVEILGELLAPLMLFVGLPGELGIVWATAMFLNIYNGLAVFFSLTSVLSEINLSQITVLMSMVLVAHSLPLEQKILQSIGIKIIPSTLFRLMGAYLYGYLLNKIYLSLDALQTIPTLPSFFQLPESNTLVSWVKNTIQFFASIYLIIFALIFFINILEKLKIDRAISYFLAKILTPIGVSKKITPTMFIGILLGISYGGGLLIKEIQEKNLHPLDVVKVGFFLSLCHSVIEDTLLVMTTGAHYSGVLIGRIIFTFGIMIVFHLITKRNKTQKNTLRLVYNFKKAKNENFS